LGPSALSEILARNWIFEGLSNDELESISALARRRVCDAKATIVTKGEPANEFFLLLRGQAKVTASASDGTDTVINVMGPGEVFGEIAILDGRPRSATVTALNDCELAVVDKRAFQDLLARCPGISLKLLGVLATRMRDLTTRLEDRAFLDISARLAKQLLWLAERYGTRAGSGVRLDLGLSQQELGDLIGATRESVNKHLREWARSGLLELGRGHLEILDFEALHKIADR
jgi:CRP/FNR family cyclic AMP-dependent transcriptional regulator